MKETDEEKKEEVVAQSTAGGKTLEVARVEKVKTERRTPGAKRAAVVALTAVVAVAAIIGLVWWWRTRSNDEGRPIPAPATTVRTGQQGTASPQAPAESTLTLNPEAVARSGLKIETVGEQLSAEAGGAGAASTGVVQANTYRTTPVISLVGGVLRRVNGELGQAVQRGQTMAVVFSDELAMAQSRYLAAQADLEEHHKHHARTLRLVEIGAASREEFEQATAKLKTAESEVASMRQRLLLLGLTPQRVGSLKNASQVSSEVSLPAPVSGTVIARSANPGEVVEANKEILRVADLSTVWVIAQVYEKDLGLIRVGSGASVTSQAYPDRIFRGRVSYVDPALDPATRTAQVRIELANPRQVLKIGMYVSVAFATTGGAESTSPVVPAAAVQNVNNQQVVFVATADPNVFVMRPVQLGPQAGGNYPVLAGLTVGERVVTEGSFMLRAEWLKLHPGGR